MEDEIKIFVAGLKECARLKKITQSDLGNAIGKDQSTISNYYRDVTRPTKSVIKIFTDFIKVSYEDVLEVGRKKLHIEPTTENGPSIKDSDLTETVAAYKEALASKNEVIALQKEKIGTLEAKIKDMEAVVGKVLGEAGTTPQNNTC